MSEEEYITKFEKNANRLIVIVTNIISKNPALNSSMFSMFCNMQLKVDKEHIAKFIMHTEEHWEEIKNKNLTHFSNIAKTILPETTNEIAKPYINYLIEHLPTLDDKSKNRIFELINANIKHSINYATLIRKKDPHYIPLLNIEEARSMFSLP